MSDTPASSSDDSSDANRTPVREEERAAAEALALVNNPVGDSGRGGPQQQAHPDGKTLYRFLSYYPFTRFFCWLAVRQYLMDKETGETPVHQLRARHPGYYRTCLLLDLVVIFVSAVILLSAAGLVLYKSIWLGSH